MKCLGTVYPWQNHHEDALSVQVADLAIVRRVGAPEYNILVHAEQSSGTYDLLGRPSPTDETGRVHWIFEAPTARNMNTPSHSVSNYALCLGQLNRFEEAKSLLRKTMPVARRVIGESRMEVTLRMRSSAR